MTDRADLFAHEDEDFVPVEPEPPTDDLGPADMPEAGTPASDPPAAPQPDVAALIALSARLAGSPAVAAFLAKRFEQAVKHGHTPESDLGLPCYMLANNAHGRFLAVLDRLRGHPSPANLEIALRTLENLGGVMLALHDRIRAEFAASPKERSDA